VVQAVPDSVKFICVDCTGCEKCRASSGATTQAVRMLTEDEQARSIAAAAPKGTYPQEDRSREPPCHACGLGYKCRSANCPNTTPDPMTGPHRKEHHDQHQP
jgi:hypothetical protein